MAVQLTTRLGALLASLVGASLLVFIVVNVLPGDPAAVILGTSATPDAVRHLHEQLGLDQPAWQRYLAWIGGVLHGDFGLSVISGAPVGPELAEKLAVSLPLAVLSVLVATVVALPLGVVAGVRHRRPSGTVISAAGLVGIGIPAFWLGLLLIDAFAIRLGWFPAGGFTPWTEDPAAALRSLILPAVTLGLIQAAVLTRFVRSAVIEVQGEDYMRTARAKGMTRWRAMRVHGLRNAAIPVLTVVGVQLTSLLVGAIVVENVFVLPGLGRLLYQAIGNRDLIMVEDLVLVLTAVVLVVNFIVDVSYRLVDPRIRGSR